ncbi:outer membrane protein assembly factor BamD [Zavarzinella formosa]|uniref:outer membrane protein assembly factor BamD n=1 Tax=Zavarzinella formosa TaxID=360055 RepID=UPI000366905D|nr:outer membrane protein assembly factor BamD [Zavarzinella formosa]
MRLGRTSIGLVLCGAALLSGCQGIGERFELPRSLRGSSSSKDVKQAGHTEGEDAAPTANVMVDADAAFKEEKFEKAEELYLAIADDTKQRPEIAERARFYQAESLRRQGYYPKATDAYHKLLQDFPSGVYRGQAIGQMFAIANEWLQPFRDEIEDAKKPADQRKKKSWTDSIVLVNFDRKLPTMDTEGRATQTLERVYLNDPTGPFADKALFILGKVNEVRGNYREASRYFQQLVETHDKSPLRDEALEMAIITKNNSSGGPMYDGRDTAEAMRLITMAKATSPKLVQEQSKMLDSQAVMVRIQQAEKDFETAEYYRRTGRYGSAWFEYELVIRRYPGIEKFAERAAERQRELKAEMDELKDPSTTTSTKWMLKKYLLGHQVPTAKIPDKPDVKELPENRSSPAVPATRADLPKDIIPNR